MSDEPTERDVEALADSIAVCFSNVSDLPEWMQVPALGRDMRPLTLIAARAVLRSDRYAERIAEARREGAAEAAERVERALLHTDPVRIGWTSQASRAAFLDGETALANRARASLRGDT